MSVPWEQAVAAAADGDVERVRALSGTIDGSSLVDSSRARWALLLAECGLLDEAATIAGSVQDSALRAELVATITPEASPEGPAGDEDELDDLQVERPAESVGPGLIDSFLRWFGGRRDLYAQQWFDERRGRSGYRPVHEPLTASVVRQHLEGRLTVGQYLLFPDATGSFGVIDLDLSSSALELLRSTRSEVSPTAHGPLRDYARRLIDAGRALGISMAAEDSGGRGAHLWVFFEPRRRARAIRAILSQVLVAGGPQPPDVTVEIFPKQEVVGPRGLSSLVKLPLGLHQRTLKRCLLLDGAFEPIEDPLAALAQLRAADPVMVDALLARRVLAFPGVDGAEASPLPALPDVGSPRSIAEALREIPDGVAVREALERMTGSCAILGGLVTKAYTERRLEAAEARALVYSLGLVGRDPVRAREVLVMANASTKELERVQRGVHSPVGCNKLQRLVAEDSRCRACPSGRAARPYATPALFAVGAMDAAPPRHLPFASWLSSSELAPDPLAVIGAGIQRIEERLSKLEERGARPGEE